MHYWCQAVQRNETHTVMQVNCTSSVSRACVRWRKAAQCDADAPTGLVSEGQSGKPASASRMGGNVSAISARAVVMDSPMYRLSNTQGGTCQVDSPVALCRETTAVGRENQRDHATGQSYKDCMRTQIGDRHFACEKQAQRAFRLQNMMEYINSERKPCAKGELG